MNKETPSIQEFRDLELTKSLLHQMAKNNNLDFIMEDASEKVIDDVAMRMHRMSVALDEYDVELQRNYLFTVAALLMLNLESLTEKMENM